MTRGALLALACVAAPLAAQEPEAAPPRVSYFPYLTSTPNDGLFGIARIIRYRQAPWDARVTNLREHSLDVGISTRESYLVRGDYKRLWLDEGWRARLRVEATRDARFGRSDSTSFSLGTPPDFAERSRQQGWLDVTRRVRGGLQVATRVSVDRQRLEGDPFELGSRFLWSAFDGPLVLCANPGCGLLWQRATITQTDFQGRAALVFDSRDNEYNPNRGLLLEAGALAGSAGDGYTGGYGVARAWFSPHRGTRLTGRYAIRSVTRTSAVGIQQEIPAWESPVTTVGGATSHRALPVGALTGRTVQLAGAELRHELLDFGSLGAITLLGFVDAGWVAEDAGDPPSLACAACVAGGPPRTTDRWIVGAGAGIGLRVLRAAQLNLTAAKANGETRWYVGSGWSW